MPATPGDSAAAFLRARATAARARRTAAPDPATAAAAAGARRRARYAEWAVLERVALRGMTLTEAAAALGIDRREALYACSTAAASPRAAASRGERQAGDDAQPVGLDVLGVDLAAGGLDDAARDREPEPAAVLERRR